MNIFEKLAVVQQEVKAPKSLFNNYGGFNYRSAEGILEALKPVLAKYGVTVIISDDMEQRGDRIYVKATACFIDTEAAENLKISCTAYAREASEKKGMDASQVTGTASSYARKYALNGLLLLDDAKDADTDEYHKQTSQGGGISAAQMDEIKMLASQGGFDLDKILTKPINQLTASQAADLAKQLKGRIDGLKGTD